MVKKMLKLYGQSLKVRVSFLESIPIFIDIAPMPINLTRTNHSEERPVVTKSLVGGVGLGVADVLWQLCEDSEQREMDWPRAAVSVSGGLIAGVCGHHGLRYLDKRALKLFPPPFAFDMKAWIYKLTLGQLMYSSVVMSIDNATRSLLLPNSYQSPPSVTLDTASSDSFGTNILASGGPKLSRPKIWEIALCNVGQ